MFTMYMASAIIILLFYVISLKQTIELDISSGKQPLTEVIKGLAIFLVVINHIGAKSGYRYFQPLGGIGVSMFLICSGYGLMTSFQQRGFDHYFKKRFMKVMVPYWIVFLMFAVVSLPSLKLVSVLKGMFLVEVVGIFWFIQFLALYYVIFFIAFSLFENKASIALLIALSCGVFILNKNLLLAEQAFAFVIGVMLAHSKQCYGQSKLVFLSTFYLGIGLLSLMVKQIDWIRESNYLLLNLNGLLIKTGSALGILYLVYLTRSIRLWRLFVPPRKFSLEIYLIHVSLAKAILTDFNLFSILVLIASSLFGVLLLRECSNIMNQMLKKASLLKDDLTRYHIEKEDSLHTLDD